VVFNVAGFVLCHTVLKLYEWRNRITRFVILIFVIYKPAPSFENEGVFLSFREVRSNGK
jgi:hypothetical protein